jgi:hypothetical protein
MSAIVSLLMVIPLMGPKPRLIKLLSSCANYDANISTLPI